MSLIWIVGLIQMDFNPLFTYLNYYITSPDFRDNSKNHQLKNTNPLSKGFV